MADADDTKEKEEQEDVEAGGTDEKLERTNDTASLDGEFFKKNVLDMRFRTREKFYT